MYICVLYSREYLQEKSTSLLHAMTPTKEAIWIINVKSAYSLLVDLQVSLKGGTMLYI